MTDSNGKRVFVRGYGSTRQEAIRRRQANLQRRLARGNIERTPRVPKISDYMDVWLSTVSEDKQNETSRIRNRRNLEAHVLPHLDKPLTSVTPDDIARLFDQTLPALGVTASSRYNAYASLRALYNYARSRQAIPPACDPLRPVEVKKPAPEVRKSDDKYVDQRLRVSRYMLEWLADPTCPLHDLYPRVLLMYLGLRRAELLGLTWDCVHGLTRKNGAYLEVQQQLLLDETGRGEGWRIERRTKTKQSRTVPLPESFRLALLMEQAKEREAAETWAEGLVFLRQDGKHVSYNEHAKDWRRVLHGYYDRHGTHPQPLTDAEYFRPHAARRLCVSLLADAGVPFETAKDILGHKTVSMTDYYHSVSQQARRDAATALNKSITPQRKGKRVAKKASESEPAPPAPTPTPTPSIDYSAFAAQVQQMLGMDEQAGDDFAAVIESFQRRQTQEATLMPQRRDPRPQ